MYRRELRIGTQIETDIPAVRQTLQAQIIETPEKKKWQKFRQFHAYQR